MATGFVFVYLAIAAIAFTFLWLTLWALGSFAHDPRQGAGGGTHSVYAAPQHRPGTVHRTRADAEAEEPEVIEPQPV